MTVVNCTREQRMINVYCKTKAKTKKSVLGLLRRLSGTFAAERRRLKHGARSAHLQLSIDISCPQGAKRQQTRWLPLQLSIDGTYRRTDGRTPNRCTDPAPHTMRTASISKTKHVDAEKYSYVIGADANIQRFVEKRLVELEVLKQTATDTQVNDDFRTIGTKVCRKL